ncbi:hypothetical protein SAMN05660420_01661 [Desulfuromusa kysingii]|uniref:Uncharacterized protein n=1 Tax=Desulfuromusa kysingii TaxID=37625 RepID=A0A1H3ZU42_9BACT|nr:hypothetical protein [Desulfuromusa kysingii]SEA26794.1 hypothetical protein SAMN05660420_01661 [Desulfuromusa kysingii]
MLSNLKLLSATDTRRPADLESCFAALGIDPEKKLLSQLPFTGDDATAGSETELQAVVVGSRGQVDLPQQIEKSRFFANLQRRTRSGETPEKLLSELQDFLSERNTQIWENSWVRFPRRRLSRFAERVLTRDLLANKQRPQEGNRKDLNRYEVVGKNNEPYLRVPISYLVKLSLADLLGNQQLKMAHLKSVGESLLEHYLNDNTSPETLSFHVERLSPQRGMGRALAKETAKRFLFTQLLLRYANLHFGLLEEGQQALIYFSPHPPLRQKTLNEIIPDAFYRQLFMSPCLSGWNCGEDKHNYMGLCHQVLSRSQLNAVAKLREAGIITNNLVVLPNVSNTSLSNNGVHISIGSQKLTAIQRQQESPFGPEHEKFLGDLSCKIMEHFLPLFATTYSAAPYRLAFADFHPEKVLGFLPHQLDFTHLRMFWRRWKKKASLSCFGQTLTPFGPQRLDRLLSNSLAMRGDLVPDFRLLDYPICFLSTEQSPAYDGNIGNQEQLKEDLVDMGVFDKQMSLYQFFKLREFAGMGFSGFEGRHYSLFPDLDKDFSGATNLQVLITALAFKYMASGQIRHRHIPDTPFVESERRQIFFGMAVGIPTFFVLRTTRNRFLLKILKQTDHIRTSRRYPGYLRVYHQDYCQALLKLLRKDGADLVEMFGFTPLLDELQQRLERPQRYSAAGRLVQEIAGNKATSPLKLDADDFNQAAEKYYREDLRLQHMQQAFAFLQEDLQELEAGNSRTDAELRPLLAQLMQDKSATTFCLTAKQDLLHDQLGSQPLQRLLNLMLLTEHRDRLLAHQRPYNPQDNHDSDPSIY